MKASDFLDSADDLGAGMSAESFLDDGEEKKSRSFGQAASDAGVSLLKGAIGLPESFVGLADIPAGGRIGKVLESVGYRPGDAKKIVDDWYSPPQKAANAAVQSAEGFGETLAAVAQNPSTIATTALESVPSMLGGASVARGVLKFAPKIAPVIAGAMGEGVVGAGSAAAQARSESKDGLLSTKQSAAAIGSGIGTGLIGFAGGKLAQRLGVSDLDTLLASGQGQAVTKGFARQVIASGISEGVFEEMPQSAQEQMWANFSAGKPITDGVGNASAVGLVSGAAMGMAGGAGNAAMRKPVAPDESMQFSAPASDSAVSLGDLYGDAPEVYSIPSGAIPETAQPAPAVAVPAPAQSVSRATPPSAPDESMQFADLTGDEAPIAPPADAVSAPVEDTAVPAPAAPDVAAPVEDVIQQAYGDSQVITDLIQSNGAGLGLGSLGETLTRVAPKVAAVKAIVASQRARAEQGAIEAAVDEVRIDADQSVDAQTREPEHPAPGELSLLQRDIAKIKARRVVAQQQAAQPGAPAQEGSAPQESAQPALDGPESAQPAAKTAPVPKTAIGREARALRQKIDAKKAAAAQAQNAPSQGGQNAVDSVLPAPSETGSKSKPEPVAAQPAIAKGKTETPEVTPESPSVAVVRGYPKDRATTLAANLTKKGLLTEAYPHPSGDGTYALRIPGGNQKEVSISGPTKAVSVEAESMAAAEAPVAAVANPASEIDQAAHEAATSPRNDLPEPSDAMKKAGNYKVGKVKISGLNISIENPEGSIRSGTDPNGKSWSNKLRSHYGYLLGTEGKDGDHVDVFVKPGTPEDYSGNVFVIDQKKGNGHFDEHKAMIGWKTQDGAVVAYKSNYAKGWDGIRAVSPMRMDQFKQWLSEGDTKQPAAAWRQEKTPIQKDIARIQARKAGEFVKAPDGSIDFGEITPEMSKAMKRQPGKIRLERGNDSYGERHIEMRHGKDIRGVGFSGVAEFVADGLRKIDALWKPSKTSQLVVIEATDHGKAVFIELRPSAGGDFYTVNSAFPTPKNYADKKSAKDGWVKLWGGMALPSSVPAAQNPSAEQSSTKAGKDVATPSGQSLAASVSNSSEENNRTEPAAKISDFGAKIGGAKKDLWATYDHKMKQAEGLDVSAEPLSKSWPEPDYQGLIDAGADPFAVAFMRASREAIPRKPAAGWKLKGWVAGVTIMRDTSARLLSGDLSSVQARQALLEASKTSRGMQDVAGRIELYQLVGHGQSLSGVKFSPGEYSLYKGVEHKPPKVLWTISKSDSESRFSNWPRELVVADSKEDALRQFKEKFDSLVITKPKEVAASFDIFSQGGASGFFIGKKVGRNIVTLAGPLDTIKEARAYREENHAELVAKLEKSKEIPKVRRESNEPRVGEDMRDGQDVTVERFADSFGFKGVEFGNWVEQKKRQKDLNEAFDALMDMAAILGVPPKALSLNGELGLAFGARGAGGIDPAVAHYEPDYVAINLTKKEGAGSLGHEWWHALDNYFSRMRGKGTDNMSEASDVSLASRQAKYLHQGAVRKEMVDAFGLVIGAIRATALKERSAKLDSKRSKEYWTTSREMSARAFESYLISKLQDQNASNDYLANIVDPVTWKAAESLGFELDESYPYPTAGEVPIIRAAFEKFFSAVETREDGGRVAMFSRNEQTKTPEFKKWFGTSKVVAADGSPLVVYHGTAADLSFFDTLALGVNTKAGSARKAFFFAASSKVASGYAMMSESRPGLRVSILENAAKSGVLPAELKKLINDHLNKPLTDSEFKQWQSEVGSVEGKSLSEYSQVGANVLPLYLSIKNPMVVDYQGSEYRERSFSSVIEEAKENGHDGVVFKSAEDSMHKDYAEVTDIYAAFNPTQIKSAIGNNGQFDVANPDIRYSRTAAPDTTIAAADLAAVVATFRKGFSGVPVVTVEHESQLPDALQQEINEADAGGEVAGALHRGSVYLVRDNLRSIEHAEDTVMHEAEHAGLRNLFGASLDPVMLDVWKSNLKVQLSAKKIKEKYGYSQVRSIEEVLAEMGPDAKSLKGWAALVSFVRAKLRKMGFVKEWTDQDVEALVLRALASLKDKGATSLYSGTALSRSDPAKFSRIIGDSGRQYTADQQSMFNTTGREVDAEAARILSKKRSTPVFEAVVKGAAQLVGIDRVTRFAGGKVRQLLDAITPESVKAGVISDYGLPDAVTDRRDTMFGHMRSQLRGVENTLARLSSLTRQESRVAHEWMNNRNADHLIAQLPDDSKTMLEELKQMIAQNGKEAVRLGLLDVDTFDRHDGAYLHRSYRKWELEDTTAQKRSRATATKILGDAYKGRGIQDLPAMASIKNAAPDWWNRKTQNGKADKQLRNQEFVRYERRAANGFSSGILSGMDGMGQLGKLLEVNYFPAGEPVPAKYGAWHEAGKWVARDTKGDKVVMWRDFTKEERVKMGEIDEVRFAVAKTLHQMIHDIEVARYFEWLASSHALPEEQLPTGAAVVEAKDTWNATFGREDWVQVPEVKIHGTKVRKYGKLAGLYVPGPVWNDIRGIANTNPTPLGETYATILKAWKISKTALSPAVHMNNVMANFVMADWHDVHARDILDALSVLVNSKDPANKQIIERFEDAGGTQGMYILSEIQREQLAPLIDQLRKEVGIANTNHEISVFSILQSLVTLRLEDAYEQGATTKVGRVVDKGIQKMMKTYNSEDTVFRMAAFMKAKREGATDVVAGRAARKSFLDYSINAPWIVALRKTAFPFIAFNYRAIPMLLDTIENRPWKLMKLGIFIGALNAVGYALSGGDEDKERRLLPEEKSGQVLGAVAPKLIRMPWNDDNGSAVFLDIRRFIPLGDIVDLGQTHAAIPLLPMTIPGGPLAVVAELIGNKSQFTGKPITKDTDEWDDKAWKVAEHLYKAFAPNLIGLPGTYATTAVWNAGNGKTDSFGREQSVATAGLSSIGIKLGAYPSDIAVQNKVIDYRQAEKEIEGNMYAAGREASKKGIDQAELKERVADELMKLQKARKKRSEAVR